MEAELSGRFYNHTAVALHDWQTYAQLAALAGERLGLQLEPPDLPGLVVDPGEPPHLSAERRWNSLVFSRSGRSGLGPPTPIAAQRQLSAECLGAHAEVHPIPHVYDKSDASSARRPRLPPARAAYWRGPSSSAVPRHPIISCYPTVLSLR